MNQPTWKHDEVFPIIARVIDARHKQQQRHVTAHEIADSLLADTEASSIIARAQLQQGSDQSLAWLANNMVAWFSQRITVGDSDWQPAFERTKIDGRWAYTPRPTQPQPDDSASDSSATPKSSDIS